MTLGLKGLMHDLYKLFYRFQKVWIQVINLYFLVSLQVGSLHAQKISNLFILSSKSWCGGKNLHQKIEVSKCIFLTIFLC